jgi:hypothetical protein
MPGNGKISKSEKCLKIAQTPSCQLHAVLGNRAPTRTLAMEMVQAKKENLCHPEPCLLIL